MLDGVKLVPKRRMMIDPNIGVVAKHIAESRNTLFGVSQTFNAKKYKVAGTAGGNFNGAVTNITVVDGIVTNVS